MAIPVQEASEVIAPFLAAGADAAIRDLGDRAGSTLAANVRRVIEKIKGNLPEDGAGPAEVATALRAGLEDGTVSGDELQVLAAGGLIVARTSYSHSTFNIGRDFHGDGG